MGIQKTTWSLQRKMDGNELLARAWKPKKLCSMSSMSDFISTLHSKTLFRCKALLPFFSFHPSLCTSSLSSVQIFKVFKDRVSKHKSPCVQHTCQDLWYSCMILHLLASKKHNNTTYGHLDVCPWHGFPSPGCGRPRRNDTTWPPMPRWKERTSWLRKLLGGNSEYFFKLTNGYKNAGMQTVNGIMKVLTFLGGSLLNIFQQQELQKENTQKKSLTPIALDLPTRKKTSFVPRFSKWFKNHNHNTPPGCAISEARGSSVSRPCLGGNPKKTRCLMFGWMKTHRYKDKELARYRWEKFQILSQ